MNSKSLIMQMLRLGKAALPAMTAVGISLYPAVLLAVPANPAPFETVQPDGTAVQIYLHGDEHFSWHEDAGGYVIKKDAKDAYWKYARPKTDMAGFDVIDDAKVGKADPAALNLKKGELPEKNILRQQFLRVILASADSTTALQTIAAPPPFQPIPVSGTKTVKNIVILASFSDHWNSIAKTVNYSYGRTFTSEYNSLFNQIGYKTDGAVGSVKDYYREVSYGKLTVDSVITPWVKLPNNEAYYGGNNTAGNDSNPQQMVADAIAAAEAAGFDFSQGDSDGDGWVDCLTVIHSGHGEEYSGSSDNSIWSHQWEMVNVATADGVKMLRYHTEPALREATGTSITRIGVIAHEMGHFFGLPDLYDYSKKTYGIGRWGLMAGGSWNGSDGRSPAHFSAWSKAMLGFVTPELQYASSTKSLPRVEDNPAVHLYRDGMRNSEYFLVENRAKFGFDNTSEIYPGIVIYHIDAKSSNNDLDTWAHPAVKIEEADGNNSLGLKNASSQARDVWTSTSFLAGGFRDTTVVQSSNAMMYQSHYYNRTLSSASYSYIWFDKFSAAGNVMTYSAQTLRPQVADNSSTTGSYAVTWGTCTNAMKYEIQEGKKVTLTAFADGAESDEAMSDNWAVQGDVQRSNGGFRTGAYSYVFQYDNISVQAMTMRKTFTVKSSTAISFYYKSHLESSSGYLKYQVSKDGGSTWLTLGTLGGYQDAWTQVNVTYAALNSLGIAVNDQVMFRFVANFERAYGWDSWPAFGYAVDDFQITGCEMADYGNWMTLANNVTANSYSVSGKVSGEYAYQVRAYANGAWQNYGAPGLVTVNVPILYDLEVNRNGTGNGTVSSNPSGISCGATCKKSFNEGQSVTLTAASDSRSTFAGWSGACSGTDTCAVYMTGSKSVIATFNIITHKLTVEKNGLGSGTVTSSPTGINCGSTCQATFNKGQSVTLTATPASGSIFVGWSNACSGLGSCVLTINADKTARATFNPGNDIDGDGIDDAWELKYFNNLITASAGSDYDHDGYSDRQEYLNSLVGNDPAGNLYDPTQKNAPGGTGYHEPAGWQAAVRLLL